MTAEEANLTEGQLRARVVGYQREEVWAPRFVEPELDATTRRLEEVGADPTMRRARAAPRRRPPAGGGVAPPVRRPRTRRPPPPPGGGPRRPHNLARPRRRARHQR